VYNMHLLKVSGMTKYYAYFVIAAMWLYLLETKGKQITLVEYTNRVDHFEWKSLLVFQ